MHLALCGRCFVPFRLWLCGLALAMISASPAFAEDTCLRPEGLPELTVQLRIEKGKFAIDRSSPNSRLNLKEFSIKFQQWSPAQLQTELFDYVDRSLAARGTVLRQLVLSTDAKSVVPSPERIAEIDTGIAQRAADDAATRSLVSRTSPWDEAALNELSQWSAELDRLGLPWAQGKGSVGEVWQRLALQAFGDGPLLSMDLRKPSALEIKDNPTVLQARQRRQLMGVLSFVVSPPFDADGSSKLRSSDNPAQWERLRSGFANDVLAPFNGQLWRRADMLRRAEDYMALRGVELRAWRRFDEQDVLCGVATAQAEPQGFPGIVLMRPGARQDAGAGRIILSSDPLPAAVYVFAGADQEKLALRALYLLLPSSDFARVRANPRWYLENVQVQWLIGPNDTMQDAWRLSFDQGPGLDLQFSKTLMTRRMLAERLQRLALLNYQARIDQLKIDLPQPVIDGVKQTRRRQVALVLEPIVATAPTDANAGTADKKEPPLDVTELGDVAAPKALADAQRAPSVLRHHLKLGVEHLGGKPLRAFGSFRRDGLSNDDTVSVEFGHSGQVLGSTAYERDFVGFDQLGRRLQLSARVYSDFTPDRMVGDLRTDVRRNGAQVNSTLDLWRDWNNSFAQAEFALSRERAETTAAGSATAGTAGGAAGAGAGTAATAGAAVEWLRRADFTLTVARSEFGTAASAHDAAVVSTSLAQASSGSYRSASLALSHHQFIGFFDRVDLRFFARGVSRRAPAAELPTFGGENTVRGLREDFAAGQALWALQSEWWMPAPWRTDSERLASLLRRQLALAAWVDTGAIYKPTTAIARRHTAVGLGLRYSQSDALTMRLDLARPVVGVGPDQRRLRLLFTVAVRPRL